MDAINRCFFAAKTQTHGAAKPAAAPVLDEVPPAQSAAPKQDSVSLSRDERKRALEEEIRQKIQEKEQQIKAMREELENSKQQTEAMRETTEKQNKCFLIAMRIMAGDKVPPADYRYLAKNNPGLYGQAVMLRMSREDPRHYKRLSEDEKQSTPRRAGDGKGPGDGGVEQAPEASAPDAGGAGGADGGDSGGGEEGGGAQA